MANALGVCLLAISLFCCTNLSYARQVPKECSKGPEVWCQSLKRGADCGAVGHCIGTVWEKHDDTVSTNKVSVKFVRLFRELKDVKELLNEEYLALRVNSECHDIPYPAISKICRENTKGLEEYLNHVLQSDTSAETMCKIIGMCNNMKLDNILSLNKKKTPVPPKYKDRLLGSSRCTWGPSYWCSNFSTGRECKMTHHCVSAVWSNMSFPVDTDSICQICTDMVKQARDQLQSNETQEELKEVFEGSCKLIPIKVVAKECIKMADDFVPELVETLASQMNPQAVCSVAGLCNNARIDDLLEGYNTQLELRTGCNNCQRTVGVLRKKFDASTYEDFLVGLLRMCRNMDSLSDSCSMLVFKYYENILEAVKKDLRPQSMCHVSGQCTHKFHSHDLYTFPEVAEVSATDDVPCELCEQLVKHLRDVLIANTTELEFYKVLKGLCKQTGKFADECIHLAEQYYPTIYQFLVSDLKADKICQMMGVCGGNLTNVPVAPLVAKELAIKAIPADKLIGAEEAKIARVPVSKPSVSVVAKPAPSAKPEPVVPPLPIERMYIGVPQNKAACSFCQYFLHYLQVELSDTKNEEVVTRAVQQACNALPQRVSAECTQFVSQYGPAVIALLVQEIDPASICPALGLCPQVEEVHHVDINAEKSNCPLCLFAVEQLETMLNNNRTEQNIRKALDGLCTHLSAKLRTECVDFVDTYTKQLVEMLVANFNAQEICVFLKLCKDEVKDPLKITPQIEKFHERPQLRGDRNNFRRRPMLPKHMLENDGDIATNEIPDRTVNGRAPHKEKSANTVCVMCEFVMKEIDDEIKDKHNEDEIKKVVHNICRRMPKSVQGQCDQFVEKYADLVISLLAQELDPSEVCEELKLCKPDQVQAKYDVAREEILDCAVCETVVMAVKKVLSNKRVDDNIVHIVEKSCALLPARYSARCHTMMEIYGDSVIHLIEEFGVKGVCQKIGLCGPSEAAYVRMYREKRN